MPYLAAVALLLLAYIAWQERGFERERQAFREEREAWVRERRDLLNRIQIPEAAPFIAEEPSEHDLPTLPEFTMDQSELERAKQELADLGYQEGPVG